MRLVGRMGRMGPMGLGLRLCAVGWVLPCGKCESFFPISRKREDEGEMSIRSFASSLYSPGMQISKFQTSSVVMLVVGVIVTVFISGCANESVQPGVQTHISGDAGVGVSSGDVSRISPSRPVPGRSY